MELSGGTFTDDGGCEGDHFCSGLRCAKDTVTGDGQQLTAPTDGSDLTLMVGWASGFAAVQMSEVCTLTPQAGETQAPTMAPPAPTVAPPAPTVAPPAPTVPVPAPTMPVPVPAPTLPVPVPAPTALLPAPSSLVPYAIVTNGTCVSHGMIDILDEDLCRVVMNDGYYNTRDQDGNGILDSNQDYPIPVVGGLPPGCWPVEPGTPGFETTEFPFACITPLEDAIGECSDNFPCFCRLPEYEVVTSGTCESNGYTDVLEETLCRALMDDGYYSTRDQDGNGVIDADQDYPIPVVTGLPPGCWPVEPGTPGFESTSFPFACITPLDGAIGDCSDNFPCFCLTNSGNPQAPVVVEEVPPPPVNYTIVINGTCASHGMNDILDEEVCRAVMNDGYYNTRDQDGNGVLDSLQDYPIPFVGGLPPGCWPVEPGTPGFEATEFPFACITLPEEAVGECSENFPCFCELPEYEIVTSGTCESHGLIDVLEETLCRALMNDGYYGTRDQDGNGIIDANQDYPIPVVGGLPPGCWPVEPGTPGFESTQFPFACITPLEEAVGDCSDNFPCFCLTPQETSIPSMAPIDDPSFSPTPTIERDDSSSSKSSKANVGLIVGVAVAAGVLVLAILGFILLRAKGVRSGEKRDDAEIISKQVDGELEIKNIPEA